MAYAVTPVKDLTKGSIQNHILAMAVPIALGMVAQFVCQLIDVYFVAKVSVAATAGVNAAGTISFATAALVQVLGVGTMTLVATAIGRDDRADANVVFNQAMILSVVCAGFAAALICLLVGPYMRSIAADVATLDAGRTFLLWMLPGSALSLPMAVLGSALRAMGVVRPVIAFYTLSVALNAVLAPILIAGWGTGTGLGVMGAGLATSISTVACCILLAAYFHNSQRDVVLSWTLMRPSFTQSYRIISIGLPVAMEMVLLFITVAVVYRVIRVFGASAQAGYGIGSRLLPILMLPGVAIALASSPIVGQNFGARNDVRVKQTFRDTLRIVLPAMVVISIVVQWQSTTLVSVFNVDASARAVASAFLKVMSWTFVTQGFVIVCVSLFQGLGNTLPSLISSCACFITYTASVMWLSSQPHFRLEHVWYLWVIAATLQAILSSVLLQSVFRRRLPSLYAEKVC